MRRVAENRVERREQFVRERREEFVFQLIRRLQLLIRTRLGSGGMMIRTVRAFPVAL